MTDYFHGAPLGALIYERTYSRDGETWPETVRRVVRGNVSLVPEEHIEDGEAELLEELMLKRALLPAGRHLWMSGVEGRQYLANCFVAPWETAERHFGFMFGELMKGGGVGSNYSARHVSTLPYVKRVPLPVFVCKRDHEDYQSIVTRLAFAAVNIDEPNWFTIPDTREGWVQALEILVKTATADEVVSPVIVFDVSKIRCKGTPIKTFGGIAAGPEPLMELLKQVTIQLAKVEGHPWSARACMAIDHHIAEAVISGNVRRSARMSIMRWDDPEINWFLECKKDPSMHWSTNISVELDWRFFHQLSNKYSEASRVFNRVIDGMLANGEPGFFNSQLASEGEPVYVDTTNPCGEIALQPGEPCVLGHVNLAYDWETPAHLERAFMLMSRFLLRATFMDSTDELTAEVLKRNRRIGVGFFGAQEYLAKQGIKMSKAAWSQFPMEMGQWKHTVREEVDYYAAKLQINPPIKTTTVAPTGTIAKLAGTSEGIHPIYSRYYIRRVRYATNDSNMPTGVHLEPDVASANTVVASFPTRDAVADRVGDAYLEQADELSPADAVAFQALVQGWYADNAISHTINVPAGTTHADLSAAIRPYLAVLKGITVFPDLSRPQSPLERITKEQYEGMTGGTIGQAEIECGPVGCPIR
jgi:adenosylcobalamin-dependent ribonucleoside-triphosphate reductase